MKKPLYHIQRYIQCGEMPLFLLFYRDRRGTPGHCAMLCSHRNLRFLLRQRKGFSDPAQFGQVLYTSHAETPNDTLRDMLRARFGFDLEEISV